MPQAFSVPCECPVAPIIELVGKTSAVTPGIRPPYARCHEIEILFGMREILNVDLLRYGSFEIVKGCVFAKPKE